MDYLTALGLSTRVHGVPQGSPLGYAYGDPNPTAEQVEPGVTQGMGLGTLGSFFDPVDALSGMGAARALGTSGTAKFLEGLGEEGELRLVRGGATRSGTPKGVLSQATSSEVAPSGVKITTRYAERPQPTHYDQIRAFVDDAIDNNLISSKVGEYLKYPMNSEEAAERGEVAGSLMERPFEDRFDETAKVISDWWNAKF